MTVDIDALAAEAVEPVEARSATLRVTLVDTELEVLPAAEWRSSAIRAIHAGNFDLWAETSLTEESWEIWQEIDPKQTEVADFFREYQRISRESLGNSAASRRSSKRTARQ